MNTPMRHFAFISCLIPTFCLAQTAQDITAIEIPPNSQIQIFADKDIHNPRSVAVATDGTVWLTETWRIDDPSQQLSNRPEWILENTQCLSSADREKIYLQWQKKYPLQDYSIHGEKVRKLVDRNSDGIADENKVFAEDFNGLLDGVAGGIFPWKKELYFACVPRIWKLSDQNGDGIVSRSERDTLRKGFGSRISSAENGLGGMTLGPDGRIYATIGDQSFELQYYRGIHRVQPNSGAVVRCELDGSGFEIVHSGLHNPRDIAFDEEGNAIVIDSASGLGDQARLIAIVEGANSGWHAGHKVQQSLTNKKNASALNPWIGEKLWQPAHDGQPAHILPPIANLEISPTGLTYLEKNSPFTHARNTFLVGDKQSSSDDSSILALHLAPSGAGFSLKSQSSFAKGIAANDITPDPKGGLIIAEQTGKSSAPANGRLLYLTTKNQPSPAPALGEIPSLDSLALAQLLSHPSATTRLHAQISLAEKNDALMHFKKASQPTNNLDAQRHAVWGLGMLARKNRSVQATEILASLLSSRHASIRAQAARALAESPLENSEILLPLLKDPHPRVRFSAALSLSRKPNAKVHDAILALLEENDNKDLYIRHAGVQALTRNSSSHQMGRLIKHPSTAVRMAAVLVLRQYKRQHLTYFLSDPDPQIRAEALRAIHDREVKNAQARLCAWIDSHWQKETLSPTQQRRLIYSAYRIGGMPNLKRLLRIASAPHFDIRVRKEALQLVSEWSETPEINASTGEYSPMTKRSNKYIAQSLNLYAPKLLSADQDIADLTLGLIKKHPIPSSTLAQIARTSRSEKIRIEALKLLALQDKDKAAQIAASAVQEPNADVVSSALEVLTDSNNVHTAPALIMATSAKHVAVRQQAWQQLAKHTHPAVPSHIATAVGQLTTEHGDAHCALEILACAETRPELIVKQALQVYRASVAGNPQKTWATALHGGDAERGKKLFQHHPKSRCAECHHVGKDIRASKPSAPDLAGIFHVGGKQHILESMIDPSAHMAPGYAQVTLHFNDHKSLSAKVIKEEKDYLDVLTDSAYLRVKRSDISRIERAPSIMPKTSDLLSAEEIRDLVAFLSTQKQHISKVSTATKPTPLHIDSSPSNKPTSSYQRGKEIYHTPGYCSDCHQPDGHGSDQHPPLHGSAWVKGPKENLIRIVQRGLAGEIQVNGKTYNSIMLPPEPELSDQEIADVLTYVRQAHGEGASAVSKQEVSAIRATETSTALLKTSELIAPEKITAPATTKSRAPHLSPFAVLMSTLWLSLCLFPALAGIGRD